MHHLEEDEEIQEEVLEEEQVHVEEENVLKK